MKLHSLPGWKTRSFNTVQDSPNHHNPPRPLPVSRRQFAGVIAGSAFAAAVGSRLWSPSLVEAGSFAPVPIPGGTPALGGAYHVFGPAAFDRSHRRRTRHNYKYGCRRRTGVCQWHGDANQQQNR